MSAVTTPCAASACCSAASTAVLSTAAPEIISPVCTPRIGAPVIWVAVPSAALSVPRAVLVGSTCAA